MLQRRIGELAEGRSAVVAIVGPAGAGKTRLLDEAVSIGASMGVRTHRGVADPATATVPLAPLLDALLHGEEPVVDAAALRALSTRPQSAFWVMQEIHDRLDQAALGAPLLIVLDDLQWVDDATSTALRSLPRRLAGHAILWLLAFRPEPAALELLAGDAERIDLGPLDAAAVAAIAYDLLGDEPDDALLDLAAQAGGRPFVIVELLRGLLEEELVVRRDGRVHLAGDQLPARLRDGVRRQLDRLSPAAREAVQMGSVLGRQFGVDELADLLERPAAALIEPLEEALRSELLVAAGDALRFRHDLLRQAVDASLPASLARGLRRQALKVMLEHGRPPSEVAVPALAVAEAADRDAIDTLRRAAAELAPTLPAQAARLIRRVLELTPAHDPARVAVVSEALPILHAAGRGSEARHFADGVLRDGLGAVEEAGLRLGIARLALQHSYAETIRQCRAALEVDGLSRPVRLHLRITLATARVLDGRDWERSRAGIEEDLAEARAIDDLPAEVASLCVCTALSLREHRYAAALEYARVGGELAQNAGPQVKQAFPDVLPAWQHQHVGRPGETLALVKDGLAAAQREGRATDVAWWLMCRSTALLSLGRLVDAGAEAEAVLEVMENLGPGGAGTIPYILGRIALHTGDPEALATAAAAAAAMRSDPALALVRQGEWLAALLADAAGDSAAAGDLLAETVANLSRLAPTLAQVPDPMDLLVLLRVLLRTGDRTGAEAVAVEAERRAALNPGFAVVVYVAAHARGLVAQLPEAMFASIDSIDVVPGPIARGSILEDAGTVLSTSDRAPAVAHLDRALTQYEEASAARDAARVRQRLRELGIRRSRRPGAAPAPGWAGLSDAELAVVRRVAAGATNRETAEQLYLSPHTVTSHLRHAFDKLGVRSRVELAALVARRDDV